MLSISCASLSGLRALSVHVRSCGCCPLDTLLFVYRVPGTRSLVRLLPPKLLPRQQIRLDPSIPHDLSQTLPQPGLKQPLRIPSNALPAMPHPCALSSRSTLDIAPFPTPLRSPRMHRSPQFHRRFPCAPPARTARPARRPQHLHLDAWNLLLTATTEFLCRATSPNTPFPFSFLPLGASHAQRLQSGSHRYRRSTICSFSLSPRRHRQLRSVSLRTVDEHPGATFQPESHRRTTLRSP